MTLARIGFIGAGSWATHNHIPLLARRDDVQLAGVCRLGGPILERVRETFGFPFATEDYRELLARDLDGVVVTSPHHLHYEHARAALEHGCHVMCEKPMALRAQEAWDLVRAAAQRHLHLIVPYGWHYEPFVQQARKLMDEQVVGDIEYVLCHMASPTKSLFTGDVRSSDGAVIARTEPSTWRVAEQGGGYAHGQVTHSAGLMFWLTGLRATQVSARMRSPNADVDLYNAANVVFDNGAIGTISGAATLPDRDEFEVDIRIFGTKGALLLDVKHKRVEVRSHDGKHQSFDDPEGQGTYSCEGPPYRFADLIQGRGTNDSPGEVGARSVELIEAMHLSASQEAAPVQVYRDAT